MAYSKYITSGATSGGTGFIHNVSNPGNNQFDWLSPDHIEIRLSNAGETLAAFSARVAAGTVAIFNPSNGYSLIGTTLTFTGLTSGQTYRFQLERVTPKLSHVVNFQAGAPLTEAALDNSNKYALFRAQELEDKIADNLVSLSSMKTAAGVTGDFVDTESAQTIKNKTFINSGSASVFDGGDYTGS